MFYRLIARLAIGTAAVAGSMWALSAEHWRTGSDSAAAFNVPAKETAADVEKLVDLARAVPPEFAADVLLRLAKSSTRTKSKRDSMLEEVFRRAAGVHQPLPLRDPSDLWDSRPKFQVSAQVLQLDALSIRCRVVKAFLLTNPRKAREFFDDIPPLEVPGLTCDNPTVYDPSEYYDTALAVAQRSFAKDERQREEHIRLLESQLRRMSSSLELPAAARMCAVVDATADQRRVLLTAYAAGLSRINDFDRSFSFAVTKLHLVEQVAALAQAATRQSVSVGGLIESLRGFLVRHLQGRRCEETVEYEQQWKDVDTSKAPVHDPVRWFNAVVKDYAEIQLAPISAAETKPAKIAGRSKVSRFWQSAGARNAMEHFDRLLVGGGDKVLKPEDRNSPEWEHNAMLCLSELERWRGESREEEFDVFHQKSVLYHRLIDITPKGALLRRVVQSYIAFLGRTPIRDESPMEWRWHLERLLLLARPMSGGAKAEMENALKRGVRVKDLPHPDGETILAELQSARDTVLYLYGNLEAAAPEVRDSWR